MDAELLEFIHLFNSRKFFESHEVLEKKWLRCRGKDKLFYQGLIQLAVALAHHVRGNSGGAKRTFSNSKKKLKKFFPRYLGLAVQNLTVKTEKYLNQGDKIPIIL